MLTTHQLSYRLHDQLLIDDVTLQFAPGQVHGIVGLNGSGKSTLLKNLSGIWTPSTGKVLWMNSDMGTWDRRKVSRTVTMVPQTPQVHFNYTVKDIVGMGCYPLEQIPSDDQVGHVLQIVDAAHLRYRSIVEISGGERQRVYIARALITQSPILLLDEPTSSLDIKHQLETWKLLRRLASQGKVIIVSCHDLAATAQSCDTITIMHQGRCMAHGKAEEVLTKGRLLDVFGVVPDKNETRSQFALP